MSTVLESALTPEQRAQAEAAAAQAADWERARQIDLPAAKVAHAALQKALQAKSPRFAQTYCSQCGCECGPGDSGMSSCIEHIRKQRTEPCTPGLSYVEFRSQYLGADVRIGYVWQDAEEHAHFPQLAGAIINEVWIGGADLAQLLIQTTSNVIEAELREHFLKKGAL